MKFAQKELLAIYSSLMVTNKMEYTPITEHLINSSDDCFFDKLIQKIYNEFDNKSEKISDEIDKDVEEWDGQS